MTIVAATVVFVGGAVALALALAFDIRPHVDQRPDISENVVAPATQAPAKPAVPAPETAAPSQVPLPASPQQDPSTRPRDHDHDWLHRHLGRGILGP